MIINTFREFTQTLAWKKIRIAFLAFVSTVLTVTLIRIVLDIGTYTSQFGDQFGVEKLFRIKYSYNDEIENYTGENGKPWNIIVYDQKGKKEEIL